jgi:hypothetical protein
MTSVLGELPLSYAVLSEGRRRGSASAVHEPSRSPESSTPRVRLHLKPGQKGTKQLLAQYGDRAIGNRHGLASPPTISSGYASPLPTWQSATG